MAVLPVPQRLGVAAYGFWFCNLLLVAASSSRVSGISDILCGIRVFACCCYCGNGRYSVTVRKSVVVP